jgi:hypothetical protein
VGPRGRACSREAVPGNPNRGSRSDDRDQMLGGGGSTDAGCAAPARGSEVTKVGADAGSRGFEVTGVGQDRREGPGELTRGTPAMRPDQRR